MTDNPTYFHLSGGMLGVGSLVEPGNWGRIIRAHNWQHSLALREMALEQARISEFPDKPSRMDSAFGFVSMEEARSFRQINGFQNHVLYRISLIDPEAPKHLTDSRLCSPQGTIRPDWARVYWMELEAQADAIPGIDWGVATGGVQLREMLTLSRLRIEERVD